MKYYLALASDVYNPIILNACISNPNDWCFLASYAYPDTNKAFEKIKKFRDTGEFLKRAGGIFYQEGLAFLNESMKKNSSKGSSLRLMVDSGAFTAWTKGIKIELNEYAEFCLKLKEQYKDLNDLSFVNLDVIGDQEKTNQNFDKLRGMGIAVLPVLTHGANEKEIKEMVQKENFICLGGLVGKRDKAIIPWLSRVFQISFEVGLKKFHLLGISRETILTKFPAYSCDSSTWCRSYHGQSNFFGKIGTIRVDGRLAAKARVITVYRDIVQFIEMAETITEIWRKRGIEWD